MVDSRALAPLVIPKSKLQFHMTELCIQDEVCQLQIPTVGSYSNYICMGDEADEASMNCRMIRVDDRTSRLDVSFRCKSGLFATASDSDAASNEPSSEIHSCYYVGDNAILVKESEHDSVTDTLACIRQKYSCKRPYKAAICKCEDDECISDTRGRMKKECNYQCRV